MSVKIVDLFMWDVFMRFYSSVTSSKSLKCFFDCVTQKALKQTTEGLLNLIILNHHISEKAFGGVFSY